MATKTNIRIRRCNGNKECWAAVSGSNDFLIATSYSLDALIYIIKERYGAPKVILELES